MNELITTSPLEHVAQDVFALVDAFRSNARSPIDLLPGVDSHEQVHRLLQVQADSIARVLGEDGAMSLDDAVNLARNAIFGNTMLPNIIAVTIRKHLGNVIPNKKR